MKYKLKKTKNSAGSFSFRTNTEDLNRLDNAQKKINEFSPYLNFSKSDLVQMAMEDFCNRINEGLVEIQINIKEKKVIFDLQKTKRK